jgi:hypothetical protein
VRIRRCLRGALLGRSLGAGRRFFFFYLRTCSYGLVGGSLGWFGLTDIYGVDFAFRFFCLRFSLVCGLRFGLV